MKQPEIKYLDRESGKMITEAVMGDSALRFAYETLLGRSLWCILFGGKFLSALMGKYYDSPSSRKKISSLTAIPGCRVEESEFPPEYYTSFNDFFARHLKPGSRPFDTSEKIISSPADGRLLVFPGINGDDPVPVKGAKRTVRELCGGRLPAAKLNVAVVRLAPVDYHRYHFPCACEMKDAPQVVAGKYHSVNPVALARHPDLFVENTRHISFLNSAAAGDFVMLEVAAFGVGSIMQTSAPGKFEKMAEKGFFKFGGSTVILVFDAGKTAFDPDLQAASAEGTEVLVRCGSSIGFCK